MKKQTYCLEETLPPSVSKRLEKIERAAECSVLDVHFSFDVGRSMFINPSGDFPFVFSVFRAFVITLSFFVCCTILRVTVQVESFWTL